jgi:hypothetical protein
MIDVVAKKKDTYDVKKKTMTLKETEIDRRRSIVPTKSVDEERAKVHIQKIADFRSPNVGRGESTRTKFGTRAYGVDIVQKILMTANSTIRSPESYACGILW